MFLAALVALMVSPRLAAAAPYDFPARAAVRTAPAPARHDTLIVVGHDALATPAELDSIERAEGPDTLTAQALAAAEGADADTSRARRSPPPEFKGFDAPRWVMLRSLAVPGWGQWHNGSWRKTLCLGGGEGVMIARIINDEHTLHRLDAEIATAHAQGNKTVEADRVAQFNARSDRSIAHQWWLGALLAYSMLDAYIDAHFRNFRIDLEDDPALPPEQRRATGLKLSWQERF